jgi:hypothetical protein
MYILLVNTNPVISRLLAMKTRDFGHVSVEEIDGRGEIPAEWYDVLFIDEQCCEERELQRYLKKIRASQKILFSSESVTGADTVDRVIQKPFLPSEIASLLDPLIQEGRSVREEREIEAEESDTMDKDEERIETLDVEESLILDRTEIEKIKRLLIEEEVESTINREEEHDAPKEKSSKMPKKKKKKRNEAVQQNQAEADFERKLLKALLKMKPEKIKKLLRGAEVQITIRFPEES